MSTKYSDIKAKHLRDSYDNKDRWQTSLKPLDNPLWPDVSYGDMDKPFWPEEVKGK